MHEFKFSHSNLMLYDTLFTCHACLPNTLEAFKNKNEELYNFDNVVD